MMHITIHNCKLKGLEEIHRLAEDLAYYFPKPDQFVTGIHELLLNAIEHGNLGLGFEAKTELIREGAWKDEIARRLTLPDYAHKYVDIRLMHDEHECRLTITDQGEGFAWKDYVKQRELGNLPNGRGLQIVFNSKFDRIMFNPAGNQVTCVVQYCRWSSVPRPDRLLSTA